MHTLAETTLSLDPKVCHQTLRSTNLPRNDVGLSGINEEEKKGSSKMGLRSVKSTKHLHSLVFMLQKHLPPTGLNFSTYKPPETL